MQYGLFMMPMHLPEKPLAQTFDHGLGRSPQFPLCPLRCEMM
jgi:hypothetical protein